MSKIKILSEEVSNRIAAGEVIERPFSVVKELVENSIDAQASKIIVHVVNGGRDLIQVIDNGIGMNEEDAQLAFERHATSKIRNVDDIIHINTLGFRGEAIPSIASVSHFTLTTKTSDSDIACEIIYDSGKLIRITPCSANQGTSITVKKLFVNVPARRKFLKTEPVEYKHILNYMHYQSVLYPHISFVLTHNGKEKFNYPIAIDTEQRLLDIFGSSFSKINFIKLSNSWNQINVAGYIEVIENSEKIIDDIHYLFVNGRFINDKTIFSALRSALEPFLKKYNHFQIGKLPSYILFLNIEAEQIDVNVHPAKLEIRFRDNQLVYQFIRQSVIDCLNEYERMKYEVVKQKISFTSSGENLTSFENQIVRKQFNIDDKDEIKTQHPSTEKQQISTFTKNSVQSFIPQENHNSINKTVVLDSFNHTQPNLSTQQYKNGLNSSNTIPYEFEIYSKLFENLDEFSNLWQVNNLYIFLQDDKGLFIIDQHAAHERIIYEKMIKRMHGEKTVRQRLLFPVVVDLPNYLSEYLFDLIEQNIELFDKIGFSIKTFSQNSIVIDEIPCELDNWDGGDVFIDLIKQLQEEFSKIEDFRDSLAKSMACKAAIKAGKKLHKKEMLSLIHDLYKCKEPFYCPHGRPLIIKIDYQELEKRFKRI